MTVKETNAVWKEFDEQKITHSATHYLFSIDGLLKENGYARAVDISRSLNITAGSCSTGLKSLVKKGFIDEDKNKFIKLTAYGEEIIKRIEKNREGLIDFFQKTLKLDEKTATVNACKIEHLIDSKVVEKMKAL